MQECKIIMYTWEYLNYNTRNPCTTNKQNDIEKHKTLLNTTNLKGHSIVPWVEVMMSIYACY